MARSLYDSAARQELLSRLDRLRPDAVPAWGRMTAPTMVTHLIEAYRMPSADLRIRRRPMPVRWLVRWLLLYVLPFPKGAPTAPELLARVRDTWDADVRQLREMIATAKEPSAAQGIGDHPIFGDMTARDWGVLLYKHTAHHFRQFGI